MKRIDYMEVAHKAMTQIKKGAFLTVQSGESINTMTIGWAMIGYVWRKPIVMVAVRLTRHTFGIIRNGGRFYRYDPLIGHEEGNYVLRHKVGTRLR